LANETPTRSAERKADGDFFLAGGAAGGEKSGDVGAGDEEHESDHAHEGEKVGARAAGEHGAAVGAVAENNLARGEFFFLFAGHTGVERKFILQDGAKGWKKSGFGLFAGDAGLETADEFCPVIVAIHEAEMVAAFGSGVDDRAHGDGEIDVGESAGLDAVEGLLDDADDGHRAVVDENALIEDRGIAAETLLPVRIGEKNDGTSAGGF
jgi:hypothetical protein